MKILGSISLSYISLTRNRAVTMKLRNADPRIKLWGSHCNQRSTKNKLMTCSNENKFSHFFHSLCFVNICFQDPFPERKKKKKKKYIYIHDDELISKLLPTQILYQSWLWSEWSQVVPSVVEDQLLWLLQPQIPQ